MEARDGGGCRGDGFEIKKDGYDRGRDVWEEEPWALGRGIFKVRACFKVSACDTEAQEVHLCLCIFLSGIMLLQDRPSCFNKILKYENLRYIETQYISFCNFQSCNGAHMSRLHMGISSVLEPKITL